MALPPYQIERLNFDTWEPIDPAGFVNYSNAELRCIDLMRHYYPIPFRVINHKGEMQFTAMSITPRDGVKLMPIYPR